MNAEESLEYNSVRIIPPYKDFRTRLQKLQADVNIALNKLDTFGSVEHNQGMAQHLVADIKIKLDNLIEAYNLFHTYTIHDNSRQIQSILLQSSSSVE